VITVFTITNAVLFINIDNMRGNNSIEETIYSIRRFIDILIVQVTSNTPNIISIRVYETKIYIA